MNVYQENGYKDRKDYLKSLAEDFDGLIAVLEDHFEGWY